MASPGLSKVRSQRHERSSFVAPILILWGVVLLAVVAFVWVDSEVGTALESFYLIPWLILAGACVVAPSVYLFYKGRFDLFHPLVFAAWSYILPAFILGGVFVALGLVNPYFLTFVEDQTYNYPLTAVIIAIGFLGLTLGFFLPVGRIASETVEPKLPAWNWKPEHTWIAGLLLLFAGLTFNILGFLQGLLGFQRAEEVNIYDGTLFFLFVILTEGTVLLWLAIFGAEKRDAVWYLFLVLLIAMLPIRMAALGSRSSLLLGLMPIAMAFLYSGRKVKGKMLITFGVVAVLAAFVGAMYGTAFRNIKGSESRISTGDYFGQVLLTVDYLTTADPVKVFGDSAQALADRIDNFSSVAVVVSRYEKLAPYEASYGLENNILNDAYTSLIPRFFWNDKPGTSDPRAYSDLYFNFSENSFAISPFGDLLRNFGIVGVPLGMMVLGFYLRFIYSTLIDTPNPAMWKKVAYYPLLTIVSYEGFYAHLMPSIVRYVVVIAVSLFIANIFVGKLKRSD